MNHAPTLSQVLGGLLPLDTQFSVCETDKEDGLKVQVKTFDLAPSTSQKEWPKGEVPYEITLHKADLAYAQGDKKGIPIWPIILLKAMQAIEGVQKLGDEGKRETRHLLRDEDGFQFGCYEERYTLCDFASLATRVTGVELRSTTRILTNTKKEKIEQHHRIFQEAATGGFTFVVQNEKIDFIIENDGTDSFKGVRLDVDKKGKMRDTNFELKGWTPSQFFPYKAIQGNLHALKADGDVHLVSPYKG